MMVQYLAQNECMTRGTTMKPKGIMVHSTGANNPYIRRYVQPDNGHLGKNKYANDWNRPGVYKCVHAFIGKLADGTVDICQTMPWNQRGWHAGNGTSGKSANDGYISFEICEDGLADCEYFNKVYAKAVELTAHLCGLYGWDPEEDGRVICHSEGYRRGIASQHGDVEHWFPKFDKSMNDFRKDVKEYMRAPKVDVYEAAKRWAVDNKVFNGDGKGNYDWDKPITREQVAQVLYNLYKGK